jgi:putative aldouronate transport system substrate-binding protein
MKRKIRAGSLLAAVLCFTFVLGACGGGKSNDSSPSASSSANPSGSASASTDPITLSISWDQQFNGTPGVQSNEVADAIKAKTGVTMDIMSMDPDKIKVMLAGGDLPDIMILPPDQAKVALDGKLVMPLNDLLAKAPNISKNKTALDVINTRLGNTDGNSYFLPINITPNAKPYSIYSPWIGWYTRWDYYKEEGYPELKSYDDMIPMLADELKKHPTTDEGKKVYGLSGWTDWNLWSYYVPFIYAEGWTENTKNTITKPDGSYVYRYAADGPFWRGVSFYNKAYRAGILDKEAFTQKYADYQAKLKAGQLLTIHMGWEIDSANAYFKAKGQTDKGFEAQVVDGATSQSIRVDSIVGLNDPWIVISKNAKNPERVIEFLDYLYSPEGSRLLLNGIQGTDWDIENGKPELTDATIKAKNDDPNYQVKTGIGLYGKFVGLGGSTVDTDGNYLDLGLNEKAITTKLNPLDIDYSAHYGGTYPGDAWNKLVEAGKAKSLSPSFIPALPALQSQGDDNLAKIENNIEQILIKETPKAVMAKDDAAFQKEKDRIMALVNKAGLPEADAFWKKSFADGMAKYQQLISGTK